MSEEKAKRNLDNQRRFVAEKEAQGLKRVILWSRPEDVDDLKLIARQPHAIAKLRRKVERELRPQIEAEIRAKLRKKTERAMLIQKRSEARMHLATSNSPPAMIRFQARPPATVRNQLKAAGWLYDPVAAVWHLPSDPNQWPAVRRLLDELDQYDIQRLALSDDETSPNL